MEGEIHAEDATLRIRLANDPISGREGRGRKDGHPTGGGSAVGPGRAPLPREAGPCPCLRPTCSLVQIAMMGLLEENDIPRPCHKGVEEGGTFGRRLETIDIEGEQTQAGTGAWGCHGIGAACCGGQAPESGVEWCAWEAYHGRGGRVFLDERRRPGDGGGEVLGVEEGEGSGGMSIVG